MSKFDDELEKALAEEEKKKKKKQSSGTTVGTMAPVRSDLLGGKFSYMPSATAAPELRIATTTRREEEDEDFAPVKKTEEKGLDFFQKSSVFDDGYDRWDVSKTILGTAGDALLEVAKGVGSLGEGIGDAIMYGAAGVADLIGKDEWADQTRKRVATSTVDAVFGRADNYLEKYSVLGRTSDSILQGVGQVGGIIATGGIGAAAGLGTAGVTALTTGTMGLSSLGSGMGEAYRGGATDQEAFTYGLISGAADAISELVFGGLGKAVNAVGFSKGLSSLDDMAAKKLTSKISNQIAKNFAEFGVKATAEGMEEVIAGFAQAWGKKATYMSEEDFEKLLKDENLLEQFVVGTLTSGMIQSGIIPGTAGGSLMESNQKKTDFITGFSQNEQAVIKKETENRIAEAEKDGEKLTAKEKSEIAAQVEKDLESGYISTDTIESVLAGDSRKAYDSLLEESKEFTTLYETEGSKLSEKQKDRLAELKQKNAENPYETALQAAREKVTQDAFELAKGDRLAESFLERERKRQVFSADVSQYKNESARQTVQNVIDSGIANNTRKFHSFVDLLAKVSEEKGLVFNVTNSEKLQGTKYIVDGKAPNGFIEGNQVTINLSSQKAIDFIAGHEITHSLEKAGLYKELQNAVEQYARTKGEYDSRLASLTARYEGKGDPSRELVADMVGEYVFTDADFVRNLSVNHRNVFQKVFDEIKYLWKVATAGSKEARELERVKKLFEEAYRENGQKNTAETSGAKYDLSRDVDGNVFVDVTEDILDTNDGESIARTIQKVISERFHNLIDVHGQKIQINKTTNDEFRRSNSANGVLAGSEQAYKDKLRTIANADEILSAARNWIGEATKHDRKDDIVEFARANVMYRVGENGYVADVLVGTRKNGAAVLYDLVNIYEKQIAEAPVTVASDNRSQRRQDASAEQMVAQTDPNVKPRFSLSDTDGRQLSQEQQEFFKDSAVRDEKGNLKVMYHGTSRGGHTVFDPYGKAKYGLFGLGSYFTDNRDVAESYTKKGKGNAPQVYETYLNIKNPMDMDAAADPAAWAEAFPEADFPESGTNEQFYRAMEEYFEDNEYVRWEAEEAAMDAIMGMGYDGITHIGGGRFNKADDTRHRVYIAFQPEQIKDVGNTKPTDDPDIRYSLGELEDAYQYNIDNDDMIGAEMLVERAANLAMPNSKIRGKDGNLTPVYHGTREMFYEFDTSVSGGKNGTAEGFGIYTSDDPEVTEAYGERQIKMYANITKPATSTKKTITASKLAALIKDTCKRQAQKMVADGEYDTVKEALLDTWVSNYVYTYDIGMDRAYRETANSILQMNDNDMAIIQEVMSGMSIRDYAEATDFYRNSLTPITGFDGFVTQWENKSIGKKSNIILAFESSQLKSADPVTRDESGNVIPLSERFNPEKADIRYSKSGGGKVAGRGEFSIPAREFLREQPKEEVAPVKQEAPVQETQYSTADELFPDDLAPIDQEIDSLRQQQEELETKLLEMTSAENFGEEFMQLSEEWSRVKTRAEALEQDAVNADADRLSSLSESEAPPEMDAPYMGEDGAERVESPLEDRDIAEVGNQKIKAYQFENPEVKPYFQEAAYGMLGDLFSGTRGERIFNDDVYYNSGGEKGWMGTKRHTTPDIAELLDQWGYSYAEIEKGLNAIIEDDGKENNACSKRIEFMLDDRLRNGYKTPSGEPIPPSQGYINLLREKQINEYSKEAFDSLFANADMYAPTAQEESVPPRQGISPTIPLPYDLKGVNKGQERTYEFTPQHTIDRRGTKPGNPGVAPTAEAVTSKSGEVKGQQALTKDAIRNQSDARATILTEEPESESKKVSGWQMFRELVLDNGMVFEKLSQKKKNRELQGKWNFMRYSTGRAQRLIGNGAEGVKSLNDIRKQVESTGQTKAFYEYLYHKHNIDRMTLEDRYEDTPNKAVFGDTITAEVSQGIVNRIERSKPEFVKWAKDVYTYNEHLRSLLVDSGVISQETADLWAEMYPHYVPVRRLGDNGLSVNVPLDTGRTGVNAPIKRATGGSRDILPLFDTMAQRTMQTYRAIAKNNFGVELKNTLGTTITKDKASLDGVLDSIDNQEGLLKEGKNGGSPTFTVFENGERVEFKITEEMYEALKPVSKALSYTNPILNKASNLHRGVLTEYNPVFLMNNAIKDIQEVVINSQHPAKTYARIPQAYKELAVKGKWYQEYIENGGEQNTYFDGETNTFAKEHRGLMKLLDGISNANNFIERAPRLAEYIASREAGRSIEVSMLDAARVTTNFAAGGRLTKLANRNGATFLNASIQGAVQQARNIQEAKMNGLKGWLSLAAKYTAAGLPAVLLNALMWKDDEEYEELSDYVKQNYYVVAKYGDGKFVRIPKGRTVAVIQNAIEQVSNMASGDAQADWGEFFKLALSNLAPNNPFADGVWAPIVQAVKNKTWYGGDLVPTRLQKLPAAEQYDESTDAISRWLSEAASSVGLDISPVKINYVMDQYSGGLGDTFLPMLTPEAESGADSFGDYLAAPFKSKFTTDSVMNNQNVSDFYDTIDKLTASANSSAATDKDILMSKYMNSVSSDVGKLYAEKRRLQNSGLPNAEKYEAVRDVQQQIVDLTRNALATYGQVTINGNYATIGDRRFEKTDNGWEKLSEDEARKLEITSAAGDSMYATDGDVHYRWYEPGEDSTAEAGWRKLSDKELERQNEITQGLGITPEEYWSKQEEYSYAYEHPENYAVAKAVGGYEAYTGYSSELYDIKADKDENGKSISGSRKEKVLDYINGLDIDYGMRLILFKNEYNADDTYNTEIIQYLDSREDISWQDMKTILTKLGFTVYDDGRIEWS